MTSASRRVPRAERAASTTELLERLAATEPGEERDDLVDQVVRLNVQVATAIARRYAGRGVEIDDLEQAACHGLVKAVNGFDPGVGKDFLTYAVPTMRGEVQRYFRDASWAVRPPRRIQELQGRLNAAIDRLSSELGREPTDAEVIADLQVSEEEYAEAVSAFGCFTPTSLDLPVREDSSVTIGQIIPAESTDEQAAEARVMLAPLMRSLGERERRILYLRFVEDRTQQEIGDELGVAQMQVSRWLSQIMRRLRDQLEPEVRRAG